MKMSRWMRLSMTLLILVGTSSCSEESPKKVPMQFAKKEIIKDASDTKVTFNRAVDILFVVDNSGSMESHQTNLAKNVKLFTQAILANQLLDYHIGVVTTDMDESSESGKLYGSLKYITRTTPNGAAILEASLQPGTGGSSEEQEFAPVVAALTPPLATGFNKGFYRPDAYLAVIMITDEEEQSYISSKDFYKFLLGLKSGDATKVITYGVYLPTGDPKCEYGEQTKLEEFFKLASSKTFGLCDVDFGMKLADLGADLVHRVGTVFYLTRPAQSDTIKVVFGSQVVPNDPKLGWIYDPSRNALIFGDDIDLKPEPPGTQVEVTFTAAQY